jgi:Tfp pilus assembly protein PilO
MIKQFIEKIPKKTLSYLVICGGIIILVVGLGIIPLYRYNSNRAQAVQNIQHQIDEQKELRQVYQLIRKASEKKEVHSLPNPAKAKLSNQDLDKFQNSFLAEVATSGMTTVSLMPDVKTMAVGSQSLLYNAAITGEFTNFRRLLIGLGALPYITQIEEINIEQTSDAMEFKLKIWIALAN